MKNTFSFTSSRCMFNVKNIQMGIVSFLFRIGEIGLVKHPLLGVYEYFSVIKNVVNLASICVQYAKNIRLMKEEGAKIDKKKLLMEYKWNDVINLLEIRYFLIVIGDEKGTIVIAVTIRCRVCSNEWVYTAIKW